MLAACFFLVSHDTPSLIRTRLKLLMDNKARLNNELLYWFKSRLA